MGKKVRVWGHVSAQNWGTTLIGNKVLIIATITPVELVALQGGTIEIGDGTFINYGVSISASQLVRIGPKCNIGTYCIMMDNDFHSLEPEKRQVKPPSAPIILEENVWLGARVIVLRGVTIGKGSVIGAGSVVTKDIPPGVLAAGSPARVIRKL
jgi:maltose O-acetyltransferase